MDSVEEGRTEKVLQLRNQAALEGNRTSVTNFHCFQSTFRAQSSSGAPLDWTEGSFQQADPETLQVS